jgi:diguanylate cyclase (GGDEF)-like protein
VTRRPTLTALLPVGRRPWAPTPISRRVRFLFSLVIAAGLLAPVAFLGHITSPATVGIGALILLIAAVTSIELPTPTPTYYPWDFAVVVAISVAFPTLDGWLALWLAAAVSVIWAPRGQEPYWVGAWSVVGLYVGLGGSLIVLTAAANDAGAPLPAVIIGVFIVGYLGFTVWYLCACFLGDGERIPLSVLWHEQREFASLELGLALPFVAFTALAVQQVGPTGILLLAPVLLALRQMSQSHLHIESVRTTALTDALTGLPNRRALERKARELLAETRGREASATLLIMDIDHFKRVNDVHGHDMGDEVLRVVGATLARYVEASSITCSAFRAGGEEFAILIQETPRAPELAAFATAVGDCIRSAGAPVPTTVSIGVATHAATPSADQASDGELDLQWQELYKAADEQLYAAKEAGRDCVRLAA